MEIWRRAKRYDTNSQDGDFIIHIPGFGPDLFDKRMAHFNHYINKVKK